MTSTRELVPVPSVAIPAHHAILSTASAPAASLLDRVAQAWSAPLLAAHLPAPAPAALDRAPLRTWQSDGQGHAQAVAFDGLFAHGHPEPDRHTFRKVGQKRLDQEIRRAAATRNKMLSDLRHATTNGRVVPKDASLHPDAFFMSYKSDDAVSLSFIRQMARIGQIEGFRVIAEADGDTADDVADALQPEEARNVSVVPLPGSRSVWVEDNAEMTLDHRVAVPAFVGDGQLVDDAILRDRMRRFHPGVHLDRTLAGDALQDEITEQYPDVDFSKHGAVDEGRHQESAIALGVAEMAKVRENLGYVEGGNELPGTLPDGSGYALVGRDSVAVSRAVLERDLEHHVTEATTLRAMARDLGIPANQLYPVEQPGEFHIDMRMALLGPGQVLLNDAREACRIQAQWVREDNHAPELPPSGASWLKRAVHRVKSSWWNHFTAPRVDATIAHLREVAERRAIYEDRTLADLQGKGLQVFRMAGVFVDPRDPDTDAANFVNCRQGVGSDGGRFYIGLGGDPRGEAYVAQQLLETSPTGIRRVHFLDRALTRETLSLWGGIKCRSKTEGTLAPSTA